MDDYELYKRLGLRIKELRIKKGMTQQELADALDLTRTSLGRYELGIKRMSIDTLQVIADYFHTTMDDLLGTQFAKEEKTTHDRVVELIKDYSLNDDEYLKMVDYLEFIVSQRDEPRKSLDQTLFELKEKQYNVFEEQAKKQTYVRSEDEKMR